MSRPLLFAVITCLAWAAVNAEQPAKTPRVIECTKDAAILQASGVRVTWEELQSPSNAVAQLLDNVQAKTASEFVAIVARPGSVKLFRSVRRQASLRTIDVSLDAVENDQKLASATPQLVQHITNKTPVFFDCRDKQVFFVDLEEISKKLLPVTTAELQGRGAEEIQRIARELCQPDIGTEYYRVNPTYLVNSSITVLEARLGAKGDDLAALQDKNCAFRRVLASIDKSRQYVALLVRDNSFAVFHAVQRIAEEGQFEVTWQLLSNDEPIKFGSGG